jgi:hypothetical protein
MDVFKKPSLKSVNVQEAISEEDSRRIYNDSIIDLYKIVTKGKKLNKKKLQDDIEHLLKFAAFLNMDLETIPRFVIETGLKSGLSLTVMNNTIKKYKGQHEAALKGPEIIPIGTMCARCLERNVVENASHYCVNCEDNLCDEHATRHKPQHKLNLIVEETKEAIEEEEKDDLNYYKQRIGEVQEECDDIYEEFGEGTELNDCNNRLEALIKKVKDKIKKSKAEFEKSEEELKRKLYAAPRIEFVPVSEKINPFTNKDIETKPTEETTTTVTEHTFQPKVNILTVRRKPKDTTTIVTEPNVDDKLKLIDTLFKEKYSIKENCIYNIVKNKIRTKNHLYQLQKILLEEFNINTKKI